MSDKREPPPGWQKIVGGKTMLPLLENQEAESLLNKGEIFIPDENGVLLNDLVVRKIVAFFGASGAERIDLEGELPAIIWQIEKDDKVLELTAYDARADASMIHDTTVSFELIRTIGDYPSESLLPSSLCVEGVTSIELVKLGNIPTITFFQDSPYMHGRLLIDNKGNASQYTKLPKPGRSPQEVS